MRCLHVGLLEMTVQLQIIGKAGVVQVWTGYKGTNGPQMHQYRPSMYA